MRTQPQPPNPALTRAYLHLQMQAMTYLRGCCDHIPREQIADLAETLRHLPEFIWPGLWSDAEFREAFLEPYDRRWSGSPASPSLIAMLEEGVRLHSLTDTSTTDDLTER